MTTTIPTALGALEKATKGPWISQDECPDWIAAVRNGETFHVADANWGTLQKEGQKGADELSANIAILAAAPQMAAWIKAVLPWMKAAREYHQRIAEMGGIETAGAARMRVASLTDLIAQAEGE